MHFFLWRASIIANQPKLNRSESIVKEIPYPENTDIFLLPLFWFISQITVSWMSVMGWKKISCQSSEGGSHLFIRSANSPNQNYLSTFWPCLPIDCSSKVKLWSKMIVYLGLLGFIWTLNETLFVRFSHLKSSNSWNCLCQKCWNCFSQRATSV